MTLPPIEKTPLLVMQFSATTKPRLIELVEERLVMGGIIVLQRIKETDGSYILRLTSTQNLIEEMAERIHLMKETEDTKTIEYFKVVERLRFSKRETRWSHMVDGSKAQANLDAHGIFTSNEWILLVRRILESIKVLPDNNPVSELSQFLENEYDADYHVHSYSESRSYRQDLSTSFRNILREHGEQSACLLHVLETNGIVTKLLGTHFPKLRHDIFQKTCWPWYKLTPDVDAIQDYYGWEIAFYFAWMGFLTNWLMFPGITGLCVFLFRKWRHDSIDDDEYTPFYGLITFVWGICFLRFWERHEDRLAYKWGVYSLSPYEKAKYFSIRPQFQGYVRKSPVTGGLEVYYPKFRRRIKYVVSGLVTLSIIVVAFAVMIFSLNLQGFIHPRFNPKRWDKNPHPFHFRSLSEMSERDQLFDSASSWRSFLPVILHVICMITLNKTYRAIAERLTDWENHETHRSHHNSLVVKRFLFEAFDCYVALFYLAFYERDVDRLRLELMAVFQVDTFRRIVFECIIPLVLRRVTHPSSRSRTAHLATRNLSMNSTIEPNDFTMAEELDKDEYDQFDDYMEIMIQLGYVTLFASAYPLASLISIAANWVEIRTDCFKLTHICSRPLSRRVAGLGTWRTLMSVVIWTSALTNCMIVGFTSNQLMHYVPGYYVVNEGGFALGHDNGWMVVFLIFGLERIMIVIGICLYAVIPGVPEDVANALERRHYVRMVRTDFDSGSERSHVLATAQEKFEESLSAFDVGKKDD